MTNQTQKIVLGSLAVVAVGLLGWVAVRHPGGKPADAELPQILPVLCANDKCNYSGEMEIKKLVFAAGAGQQPTRSPAFGPGYKCPKCGQNTLYTQPMKCKGCGALFLARMDAAGTVVRTCPKCGKDY